MDHLILLVEDEENIRKFTKINLEREGFQVIEAGTGEDGIDMVLEYNPDIVILDIMLPGMDGYEVCNILREKASDIGIIMLTAKTQDEDKIAGLEQGADDYLSKPFNPKELSLRIQSLIRRLGKDKGDENIIHQHPFKMDLYSKIFTKNNEQIILTPTEQSIMIHFMENPNKAITREELLKEHWGENYDGADKTVDVNIRRLRAKIEDNPKNPQFIETVWGTGYRWKVK